MGWLFGVAALAATLAGVACIQPNRADPADTAPATTRPGASGGGSGGVDGSSSRDVPAPSGPENSSGGANGGAPPPADPSCEPGFHRCAGVCVDGKRPAHCGVACDPCPSVTGGEATCDGLKCGVSCPAGKKACPATNSCIGMDEICDGACPAGKNACNGLCVPATEKTACGSACVPCSNPSNGRSECDGTQCVITCNPGFHRCGDACVDDKLVAHCGVSCTPCPVPTGGTATCDGTSCGTSCPMGSKACLGACIGADKPCDGQCPTGQHSCNGNCVSDSDVNSCGTSSCMPCAAPAGGKATCVSGACDFECTTGTKCNGKCVSTENCGNGADDDCDGQVDCADQQCAAGTTCGANSVCRAAVCVQLKERGETCGNTAECRSGSCTGGRCCNSGEKSCDGQCRASSYCCDGTSCPISNGKGACSGGACQRSSCNSGYKPQGTNQCVDACSGVSCPACQQCEDGACRPKAANAACSGGKCDGKGSCVECGGDGAPCCDNGTCNSGSLTCGDRLLGTPPSYRCSACGRDGQLCCRARSGATGSCSGGLTCGGNGRCADPKKMTGAVCGNNNDCYSLRCRGRCENDSSKKCEAAGDCPVEGTGNFYSCLDPFRCD